MGHNCEAKSTYRRGAFVRIPSQSFLMGSTEFYPEEGPVVERKVSTFQVATRPVTNSDFLQFVESTGYVTTAEQPFDLGVGSHTGGSLCFRPSTEPVDLSDWTNWWEWTPGANWRHPLGAGSEIGGIMDHPVVHVSHIDALAFCDWSGTRLMTEVEWECAARGGLEGKRFAWGDEYLVDGELMANSWQGRFPYLNYGAKGYMGTSPVGTFPPNGFGLYDMTGNVWEWTSSQWKGSHESHCDCSPKLEDDLQEMWVVKGGSHLCAPEYCIRYRPAARSSQETASSTSHIGFRVAKN